MFTGVSDGNGQLKYTQWGKHPEKSSVYRDSMTWLNYCLPQDFKIRLNNFGKICDTDMVG